MMKNNIKQVIVIRKDLNMRKGKIAAQACHASLSAVLQAMLKVECFTWGYDEKNNKINFSSDIVNEGEYLENWFGADYRKIVLYVNSEEELLSIKQIADEANLICALITDNGLTEFNGVPTKTCLAFEPLPDNVIDPLTGHLSLL